MVDTSLNHGPPGLRPSAAIRPTDGLILSTHGSRLNSRSQDRPGRSRWTEKSLDRESFLGPPRKCREGILGTARTVPTGILDRGRRDVYFLVHGTVVPRVRVAVEAVGELLPAVGQDV